MELSLPCLLSFSLFQLGRGPNTQRAGIVERPGRYASQVDLSAPEPNVSLEEGRFGRVRPPGLKESRALHAAAASPGLRSIDTVKTCRRCGAEGPDGSCRQPPRTSQACG